MKFKIIPIILAALMLSGCNVAIDRGEGSTVVPEVSTPQKNEDTIPSEPQEKTDAPEPAESPSAPSDGETDAPAESPTAPSDAATDTPTDAPQTPEHTILAGEETTAAPTDPETDAPTSSDDTASRPADTTAEPTVSKPIEITDSNFADEVLASDKLVILDFYADWCGPCKTFAPILEEFASEHPEVKVGKINVDYAMSLAYRYNIEVIPTVIVIKNGSVVYRATGVHTKADLAQVIERLK